MTTDTPMTEDAAPEIPVEESVAPTPTRTFRIFDDLEAARVAIIRRAPLSEPVLAEAVQAGINELWGEPVTPAAHVARILDAVAREGDAAVSRFSQRFDGSAYEAIEVTADEIAEAFELVSPE